MPHDLGILEDCMMHQHTRCMQHYPRGYRMQFVPYDQVMSTPKLQAAIQACIKRDEGGCDDR